ncbi:ABC transporter substrate-binding protein [Marinobacter confluentis]|uniref:ABC transporter substrate-binding protein n=1 Tax=Marinobacter confluentis TaxID=1697557 RepID=A0A4Z1BNY5_9GAMM|nr:ABC transporter substrate-binding protein [Marinobacter confluentis]TGN41717.1 ABC transporter substrate-binding protein [Marinobacter confluentis]
MRDTQSFGHHQEPPTPATRLNSLALVLVLVMVCLAFSSITRAQATFISPATTLVYIADSENQRLNQRLRELLSDAFGESVMMRSFVSGQTSQDSESPVIAIGPTAFTRVREENAQVPVLGLLVEEAYIRAGAKVDEGKVSAILSTPPLIRQVAIGKTILPYSTRVAMLARPDTEHLYESVLDELKELEMEGRVFLVASDERLIPTLIRALNYGDFVLAAPDSSIYNPRTIKHILLTAYRRNRIVIGPSQAYVKAGSLASSYTPLSSIADMAARYIAHFREHDAFPEPAYPTDFGIEINRQVGRSLNIPLPERQTLIDAVIERLESVEANAND